MHHAQRMCVRQRIHHVAQQPDRRTHRKLALAHQLLAQ